MSEKMIADQYKQERTWNDVKIDDKIYMISVTQKDDKLEVILTNLIEIWIEILTDEIIYKRCKDLNPLLNITALNYKNIVANILNNIQKYIDKASVQQIKLRIQIDGGSMKFVLNLSKGTPQDFWEMITKPLCLSSIEINRQYKILLDLVKKKDKEIAEYKAEGVELLRKNIETKVFNEEQLNTTISFPNIINYNSAFQTCVNFCNELNLWKWSEIGQNFTSDNSKDNSMAQTEQSSIISTNNEHTNESEKDTLKNIKIAAPNGKKKVINSNTKTINTMHKKPIKRLHKGLNTFI
nr:uncharacterized protein LOC116427479 [Nomia melanderi]XP_031833742.1 uncharacterized protein LOC116427479 [Nomia melanderi]XP_031833743.1 uncharacterized protein LOC116427479 [Nomia melanderi]